MCNPKNIFTCCTKTAQEKLDKPRNSKIIAVLWEGPEVNLVFYKMLILQKLFKTKLKCILASTKLIQRNLQLY